jgi:hypothetical protein
MAKLIYSAISSLDGYIENEAGKFDWAVPDEEVHAFINDLERPVTVREGAFHAPFGAPTDGPPPYQRCALTPHVILGLGTNEKYNFRSTRWRF